MAITTKGRKKKDKKVVKEFQFRTPGSPLSLFSEYKKVDPKKIKRRPIRKGKSTETKLEKDYQKQAFIEKRMKGSQAKKDTEKQKKKLFEIFSHQFERRYQTKEGTYRAKGGKVK